MSKSKPSWHLVDAAAIATANPYTFYKPSAEAIALCRPGNLVKLIFEFVSADPGAPRAERMWVQIVRVDDGRFSGTLANEPLFITDLKDGDAVEFDSRHIIETDIDDPVPDPTAPFQRCCFVTERLFATGARAGRLFRLSPVHGRDS